jgi:thioredoxin-dependent peroxiredoxin
MEENDMADNNRIVTMKGNPLALAGQLINVGDAAPDCELTANDMAPTKLSFYKGKVVILSTVPSLDTPVCDIETRRFNVEAGKLGREVAVLTISMDLPFAQKRWCGAAGVENVITLSDHRSAAFGTAFGVLIPALRLLARAVFVLDRQGVVRYIQIVNEIASEPDYNAVLEAVKALR